MAKKILLADDSVTIQKVVELTFSDGDYEVVATNNGAKAIQKLQEVKPDIVLSDIIMPDKNGYEVCEFIKSNPEFRHIPVILLTGTFEPFDPDRAERAGCDAVITKPFESQSLISKVEELIEQADKPEAASTSKPESSPTPRSLDDTSSLGGAKKGWDEPAQPSSSRSSRPTPEEIFGAAPAPPQKKEEERDEVFSESDDEPTDTYSAETTAFPKMSFEELQRMKGNESASPFESADEEETREEPAPAGEGFDFSASTTAFPKMSFDDLPSAKEPEPAKPEPEIEQEPSPTERFGQASYQSEASPFGDEEEQEEEREETPAEDESVSEPSWSSAAEAEQKKPASDVPAAGGSSLSDEQVDRIARRVVELISEKIVRDVAWEVIPDLAQSIVRERIKELESED